MTTEGAESDYRRQLHDDVKRTISEILPRAVTEVLDEILRDYREKLSSRFENNPRQPISNLTYAQFAKEAFNLPAEYFCITT